MKVNWKVRFKNRIWLSSFICTVISFAYNIMGMLDIFPAITQNSVVQIVNEILLFLSLIGVIADPTTEGLNDSQRAMSYEEPWSDG